MNAKELRTLAAKFNIAGRSKMTKPELEAALKSEGCDLVTAEENITVVDSLTEVQERILEEVAPRPAQGDRTAITSLIEAEVAAGRIPFPYGLRGRGIGAKTYLLVSDRSLTQQANALSRAQSGNPLSSPARKLNSERVQAYARTNGKKTLTHRQWGRVLAKTTGQDDITVSDVRQDSRYFSHIGTTPRGAGIYFQFAR